MFPLRRQAVVFGDDGPAVAQLLDVAFAGVNHGLNGKHHAGLQFKASTWLAVMQHLRIFMEFFADTVAAKFTYHAAAVFFGVGLNRRSEEHTSELQSQSNLVCRLLLE